MKQEFSELHRSDGNEIIESLFRSLEEESVRQYHFESLSQAMHIIGQYIHYHNIEQTHPSLGYRTTAEFTFPETKIA